MTSLWLASYILLWIVVVGLCLLCAGMLQHIGMLQLRLEHPASMPTENTSEAIIPLENDGPLIGSPLPEFTSDTINGFGSVTTHPSPQQNLLLLFMSPLCESCQHVVDPLNQLVTTGNFNGVILVILKADKQACSAFLSIFPLHTPVICDGDRTLTMGFQVHRNPFALLYDADKLIIRKGVIENAAQLQIFWKTCPMFR